MLKNRGYTIVKELTEKQRDALSELLNMGFARTASSLSQLTGDRVLLEAPYVSIHPIEELSKELAHFVTGEIATVQQIFTGNVSGNALLLLNYDGASILTDMVDPDFDEENEDSTGIPNGEVLTEIGNILLNSCMSVFGNILNISISFSVPRLYLEALDGLLHSLVIKEKEMRYAMLVYTSFHLRNNAIKGYMIMILSVSSLDNLLLAVESWADEVLQDD
jgi:chemotaxis protein CheC